MSQLVLLRPLSGCRRPNHQFRRPSVDGQKSVFLEPLQLALSINRCVVYSFSIDEAMDNTTGRARSTFSARRWEANLWRWHGDDVTSIDYLRMDIEWAEWHISCRRWQILQSGMLDKVRQLAIEFHLSFTALLFDADQGPIPVPLFHHPLCRDLRDGSVSIPSTTFPSSRKSPR